MRDNLPEFYSARSSQRWLARWMRRLAPPVPLVQNPNEPTGFPLGKWNLYIGGAGRRTPGYVNIDLFAVRGVDVAADAGLLPFRSGMFTRVECDAVLEHVRDPEAVLREIERVLIPGGMAHLVTPFCHPFHEFPADYRRFTPDGLRELAAGFEVAAEGWRTGPTATILVFLIEYFKLLLPWRVWRGLVHFTLGWALFPFRYLDLALFHSPAAGRLGNHCYLWLRKPLEDSVRPAAGTAPAGAPASPA